MTSERILPEVMFYLSLCAPHYALPDIYRRLAAIPAMA